MRDDDDTTSSLDFTELRDFELHILGMSEEAHIGKTLVALEIEESGNPGLAIGAPLRGLHVGAVAIIDLLDFTPFFNLAPTLIEGAGISHQFGSQIVLAGDLSGDGVGGDLLIAAISYEESGSQWFRGGVFGFEGPAEEINSAEGGRLVWGQVDDENTGQSIGVAFDIDDDGFQDFFVGSGQRELGGGSGRIDFYRGPMVPGQEPELISSVHGLFVGQLEVHKAMVIEDWTGDGLPDLAVGARRTNPDGLFANGSEGALYVMSIPTSGDRSLDEAEFQVLGESGAELGSSLAITDLDCDGSYELGVASRTLGAIIGYPWGTMGTYLLTEAPMVVLQNMDVPVFGFGIGLDSVPELCAVAVGAPVSGPGGTGSGTVITYVGDGGVDRRSIFVGDRTRSQDLDESTSGDNAGGAVAFVGDIDGDGLPELAVSRDGALAAGRWRAGIVTIVPSSAIFPEP